MTKESEQETKRKERVKAWTPKVRTGCRTCKRRKIKCDEGKPSCQRCLKARLVCDGYDAVPKTWIFEHPQPKETATSGPLVLGKNSSSEAINRNQPSNILTLSARVPSAEVCCARCLRARYDCVCPEGSATAALSIAQLAKRTSRLGLQPSGRYKTAEEQYFFKYFMEVAAVSVARSDISGIFWLNYFPRAAYHHDAIKDALLSTATTFQSVNKHILLQAPIVDVNPRAMKYENRAIDTLVRESPSVESMLVASCGFWFGAVACGDWAKSLQHCFHALKILDGIKERSKHDQLVLRYTEILARASLGYFRATRGPCRFHPRESLTECDAMCFVPEAMAVELRVADAVFHLHEAILRLEHCVQLLEDMAEPHKQHARILGLIQKQEREVRYLARKWSDAEHLGMSSTTLAQAAKIVPVTFSPFPPVHDALQDFIEIGEQSKFTFGELELRMRVLMPNLMVATSQGHPALLTDTCTLLFATTYIEGRRNLENEPGRKIAEQIVEEFELPGDSPT